MTTTNPTPTTTTTTVQSSSSLATISSSQPKTRDTCDACAKSKVRCGKQHPQCDRCAARNQPCAYGLVRPRGRPRLVSPVVVSPGGSGLGWPPGGKDICMSMVECGGQKGSRRTPTDVLGDMIAAGQEGVGANGNGEGWHGLGCEIGGLFDIVPPGENMGGFEMGLVGPSSESSSPSSSGSGSGESSLGAGNSVQSCMGLILSALQALHPPSETCLLQASVSPSRTLDAILQLNRSAMDTLTSVMGCPCSLEPAFASLIAQVLLHILDWYQVVLDDPDPNLGMGSMQVQILTGESEVNEDDPRRVVVQVVLNDVEKVRLLVEGFARAYCREGMVVGGEQQVCLILEGELRRKLGGVMSAAVLRMVG